MQKTRATGESIFVTQGSANKKVNAGDSTGMAQAVTDNSPAFQGWVGMSP